MIGYSNLDSSNGYMDGFISNFRVIKGTALYTSRFTPPAAPLTDVTNTKLLCCQSNAQAGAAATAPNMGGVNDGTQWSSYLTVSDSFTASGRAAGFDGSTGTYSQPSANSSSITWAPSGGITYSTSVEVYTYQSNGVFTTVSDGAQSVSWTTLYQGWKTIASGGGTFTSTTLTSGNPSVSDSRPTFAAVRVDGTILVDPLSPYGDVAATNFNPFNTDIHIVRGQETGYATLNPLNNNGGTLSNGNLSLTSSGAANVSATLQIPTTGKYYWEYFLDGTTSGGVVGIADGSAMNGTALGDWTKIYGYSPNGNKYENASASSYGATLATGDLVGVKYDADTRQLEFLKNNISQGVAYTVSGDYDYYPSIHGNVLEVIANFGQKPFKFSPPDGFQPLNNANVRPVKVFSRPDQYVGVTTYKGTGASKTFSLNHSPDFLWVKQRGGSSTSHALLDSVRANGSSRLISNSNNAEVDVNQYGGGVTAFNSNGFTLGTWTSVNGSNEDFVAWTWKAGGNKNTFNVDDVGYASAAAAGLSCTADLVGASVGTKQGFSIIQYQATSGETVAHGLSEQPSFMMIKNMDSANDWMVYHKNGNGSGGDLSGSQGLNLNNADATFNSGSNTFITGKSATTFTVGSSAVVQNGSDDMIAYIWHDVPGLQKFGVYTGNNNADGPYVELGFRPAVLMVKRSDGNGDWFILDTERAEHNPVNTRLWANLSNAESSSSVIPHDILSNGFKVRNTETTFNASGGYFIYMAWAEAPSVDLYGGGANAR